MSEILEKDVKQESIGQSYCNCGLCIIDSVRVILKDQNKIIGFHLI